MQKQKLAFTLVELIVVITILAILGTIAFISLQGYSAQSRDVKKISDIQNIKKSLELFSLNTGKYPLPDKGEKVLYESDLVWIQGTIGDNVTKNLSKNLSKKPVDPLSELEYTYSIINSSTKYEILSIYESDYFGYNILNKSFAANANYPKIDGTYNGIFVKTSNYYIPTPSIITSEKFNSGLTLNGENIKSQIITGGKNIPKLGLINSNTGKLNINFEVFTGSIDKNSTPEEKENFVKIIQNVYTGSILANKDIYKVILNTTEQEEFNSIINDVVLNNNVSSSPKVITSCNGTANGSTRSFYDIGFVEAGSSCTSHRKLFTCDNGEWRDGENLADTITYLYNSCKIADDIEAPTGGNLSIPSNSSTTSINLSITCPTDLAGSNPVQMYISGNITNSSVWETCSSSKSLTLSAGDGIKTITIKWKDSAGNETNSISKQTSYSSCVANVGDSCDKGYWGTISGCNTNYGCAKRRVHYNVTNCSGGSIAAYDTSWGCTYVGYASYDPFVKGVLSRYNDPGCTNVTPRYGSTASMYLDRAPSQSYCSTNKWISVPGIIQCAGACQ